jgi:hypothetical protein
MLFEASLWFLKRQQQGTKPQTLAYVLTVRTHTLQLLLLLLLDLHQCSTMRYQDGHTNFFVCSCSFAMCWHRNPLVAFVIQDNDVTHL